MPCMQSGEARSGGLTCRKGTGCDGVDFYLAALHAVRRTTRELCATPSAWRVAPRGSRPEALIVGCRRAGEEIPAAGCRADLALARRGVPVLIRSRCTRLCGIADQNWTDPAKPGFDPSRVNDVEWLVDARYSSGYSASETEGPGR